MTIKKKNITRVKKIAITRRCYECNQPMGHKYGRYELTQWINVYKTGLLGICEECHYKELHAKAAERKKKIEIKREYTRLMINLAKTTPQEPPVGSNQAKEA